MTILSPKALERVEEMATEKCMAIVDFLLDTLIVDGQTYGDIPVTRPQDFVPFYLDLEARGVTRTLAVVNPQLARDYRARFQREAAKLMKLRP